MQHRCPHCFIDMLSSSKCLGRVGNTRHQRLKGSSQGAAPEAPVASHYSKEIVRIQYTVIYIYMYLNQYKYRSPNHFFDRHTKYRQEHDPNFNTRFTLIQEHRSLFYQKPFILCDGVKKTKHINHHTSRSLCQKIDWPHLQEHCLRRLPIHPPFQSISGQQRGEAVLSLAGTPAPEGAGGSEIQPAAAVVVKVPGKISDELPPLGHWMKRSLGCEKHVSWFMVIYMFIYICLKQCFRTNLEKTQHNGAVATLTCSYTFLKPILGQSQRVGQLENPSQDLYLIVLVTPVYQAFLFFWDQPIHVQAEITCMFLSLVTVYSRFE